MAFSLSSHCYQSGKYDNNNYKTERHNSRFLFWYTLLTALQIASNNMHECPRHSHVQIMCSTLVLSPESAFRLLFRQAKFSSLGMICTLVPFCVCVWQLWNLSDGSIHSEYKGHREAIEACTFLPSSPQQSLIATASRDCSLKVWDMFSKGNTSSFCCCFL